MDTVYNAPQPSVTHLVSLFRQIATGEVRIPAFQRGFIWQEKQVIDLLGSVYESYPIGSVLLWTVFDARYRLKPSIDLPFPIIEERFPTNYVLDGMQRLSTLYGVFNYGKTTTDQIFNVGFDLRTSKFHHLENSDFSNEPLVVPLSVIFDPRSLIAVQAKILEACEDEAMIDKLISLQSSFQDYMIPVVKIVEDDISRVVRIFEKINSAGTRLDALDFMRAITWAQEFDLSERLSSLQERFEAQEYALEDETVVKCAALTLGLAPTSDGLLKLRNQEVAQLDQAFNEASEGISSVIAFLRAELSIGSNDLVPYEGQFLILYKALICDKASSDWIPLLKRWFLASSLNEALRGKPDHYVDRAVSNWKALVEGGIRGLEPRLKLNPLDFAERRLIKGKSLSSAYLMLYAAQQPLDLESRVGLRGNLGSWSTAVGVLRSIIDRAQFPEANVSIKTLSNIIATQNHSGAPGYLVDQIIRAGEQREWEILSGHFITPEAVDCLRTGEWSNFLRVRGAVMHRAALEILGD